MLISVIIKYCQTYIRDLNKTVVEHIVTSNRNMKSLHIHTKSKTCILTFYLKIEKLLIVILNDLNSKLKSASRKFYF